MKDVNDLLDDSNYNFLSYPAFITKYNIKTNYLEYYKFVSALKHFRKNVPTIKTSLPWKKPPTTCSLPRKSAKFLCSFAQKKDFLTSEKPGKEACWRSFSNVQVNWENTYHLPFLCTTETKLRVFQFKFLQRRVATNDFLLQIGKKETDSCSFWPGSPATLTHLFWHCRATQTFWNNVSQWTSEELDLTNLNITPFSPALCLGLIDIISNFLLHHFLLIARHYILHLPEVNRKTRNENSQQILENIGYGLGVTP